MWTRTKSARFLQTVHGRKMEVITWWRQMVPVVLLFQKKRPNCSLKTFNGSKDGNKNWNLILELILGQTLKFNFAIKIISDIYNSCVKWTVFTYNRVSIKKKPVYVLWTLSKYLGFKWRVSKWDTPIFIHLHFRIIVLN